MKTEFLYGTKYHVFNTDAAREFFLKTLCDPVHKIKKLKTLDPHRPRSIAHTHARTRVHTYLFS